MEPTTQPTSNPTILADEDNLEYILAWWLDGNNLGWKAFIIVGIVLGLIGCVCIACMCGYLRGKDSKRNKNRYGGSKNQFGFVPDDIELGNKEVNIYRYFITF